MKKFIGLTMIILLISSCDIQQKKEAKLPEVEVDIDTEAGQLPTFDVDWANVMLEPKQELSQFLKLLW